MNTLQSFTSTIRCLDWSLLVVFSKPACWLYELLAWILDEILTNNCKLTAVSKSAGTSVPGYLCCGREQIQKQF